MSKYLIVIDEGDILEFLEAETLDKAKDIIHEQLGIAIADRFERFTDIKVVNVYEGNPDKAKQILEDNNFKVKRIFECYTIQCEKDDDWSACYLALVEVE